MKLSRSILAVALSFSLSLVAFIALPIHSVTAQDSRVALQRGFRTGYSDGYMAGYRDSIDGAVKEFARHGEYSKATRAYNKEYGSVEDYSDGYRQGFESGYGTGFEKRSFEANVPADLSRRGTSIPAVKAPTIPQENMPAVAEHPAPVPVNTDPAVSDSTPSVTTESFQKTSFTPVSDAVIIIPRDTEIIVEMSESLSTERSREGDKFTSKVVSPAEIAGAIIEGRINKITKPGRIKRRSELQLSFDRIILTESRWSNFNVGDLLEEVRLRVRGVDGGQDDDRQVRARLDLAGEGEPVHPGHHHVDDQQVRPAAVEPAERLLAVARRLDLEPIGAQLIREQHEQVRVVIDDEDARRPGAAPPTAAQHGRRIHAGVRAPSGPRSGSGRGAGRSRAPGCARGRRDDRGGSG